jgi:hypothetical protein
MALMNIETLDAALTSKDRTQLQAWAKKVDSIKANGTNEKMHELLKVHYEKTNPTTPGTVYKDCALEVEEAIKLQKQILEKHNAEKEQITTEYETKFNRQKKYIETLTYEAKGAETEAEANETKLTNQLAASKSSAKTLKEKTTGLQNMIGKQKIELATLNTKNDALNRTVKKLTTENKNIKTAAENANASKSEEHEEQLAELTEMVVDLQQNLANKETACQEQKTENATITATYKRQINQKKEQCDKLQKELTDTQDELYVCMASNETLTATNVALEKKNEESASLGIPGSINDNYLGFVHALEASMLPEDEIIKICNDWKKNGRFTLPTRSVAVGDGLILMHAAYHTHRDADAGAETLVSDDRPLYWMFAQLLFTSATPKKPPHNKIILPRTRHSYAIMANASKAWTSLQEQMIEHLCTNRNKSEFQVGIRASRWIDCEFPNAFLRNSAQVAFTVDLAA